MAVGHWLVISPVKLALFSLKVKLVLPFVMIWTILLNFTTLFLLLSNPPKTCTVCKWNGLASAFPTLRPAPSLKSIVPCSILLFTGLSTLTPTLGPEATKTPSALTLESFIV
ncbi:hypothetical protein ES288_A13G154900v1 [Gossypium darwinii]|uniref:Uncharacterized protein n=1 Tax=Gossypium darwinii TaxID=34276 RepID=A0A5D2E0F3_GOSDA|nr:hypothetical protein ES288_A13G154900v1 [Gossypium darwinii]